MQTHRFALSFALALPLMLGSNTRAEVPRKSPPPGDTLQAVLDRIHNHAAGEAWKEPGWKDDAIEAWLDKLVGSVAKALDWPELKLPIRLADTAPGDPANMRSLRKTLIVGSDVNLRGISVRDSIILADGSVEVDSIRGSVVVARRAITVNNLSEQSVLVGGAHVRVAGFDGQPMSTSNGSLIISRGWADIATTYGTMIVALQGVNSRSMPSATIVNTPAPVQNDGPLPGARNGAVRIVSILDFPLEALPIHPLAKELDVIGVVCKEAKPLPGRVPLFRRDTQPIGLVFRYAGRRHVATLGTAIVDDVDSIVEPLRDWKLTHVNEKLAILSKGSSDVVLRVGE